MLSKYILNHNLKTKQNKNKEVSLSVEYTLRAEIVKLY